MPEDQEFETSFEEMRRRLVHTLHSQAFEWVRMNSVFYWYKNGAGIVPSDLSDDDFEFYGYLKKSSREDRPIFCGYIAEAQAVLPPSAHPCAVSNMQAVRDAVRMRKFFIYTCYVGITDMAIPLFDGDLLVGVWVMGQVLRQPPSKKHFSEIVQRLGKLTDRIDLAKLRKAYSALPVVPENELRQVLNTLTLAWDNTLEQRKRESLQKQLEPYIKKGLVLDILAGKIGSVEHIIEKAGTLQLHAVPTTAVVISMAKNPRGRDQAELSARALTIVEESMSQFDSSVTALVAPGRIVAFAAARFFRDKTHFRLLLREAADRACQTIQAELSVTAVAGVGTVREHMGEVRHSYKDALAELAEGIPPRRLVEISSEESRKELMMLAAKLVRQLGTATSSEIEALFRKICVQGTRLADENLAWTAAFSAYLIGMVANSQAVDSDNVVSKKIGAIAATALAELSQVTDPLEMETCLMEVLHGIRSTLIPSEINDRGTLCAEKAKAFIEANCHRKITLEDICAHVYISRRELQRVFKKHMHVTCTGYFSQCRLDLAKILLAESKVHIKEIAVRMGFSHSNSFARWFRRMHGASPVEFRRAAVHHKPHSRVR